MKLTLKQIIEIDAQLDLLLTYKIEGVILHYKINRIKKVINPIIVSYREQHLALVTKYGDVNDETGVINVKQEELENFFNEYNPLVQTEEEINPGTIKLSELQEVNFKTNIEAQTFFGIMGELIIN